MAIDLAFYWSFAIPAFFPPSLSLFLSPPPLFLSLKDCIFE